MNKSWEYIERKTNEQLDAIKVIVIAPLIIIAGVLCSCKSLPDPIPTNSRAREGDSVRTELRIDTIYRDRWHTEYTRGDTFFIHDSIDRWKIRDVYIHDSIDNSRIDTIYKTVEVEKQYKAFLVRSGVALWIILAVLIVAVIVGIVIKFAK